jgi:hypothetical protein
VTTTVRSTTPSLGGGAALMPGVTIT